MRAQVLVLGPIEREMYVRLTQDFLPEGTKRAEELTWRIVGCGVEVSERLARLGLSAAIVTGVGTKAEDKEVLSIMRKRGVQLRSVRSEARPAPLTVRIQTPRHNVRMVASALEPTPSSRAVMRALPGSRHFHICGSLIVGHQGLETAKASVARAAASGVSTSLDIHHMSLRGPHWKTVRELLGSVNILFASSEALRALTEQGRVGKAAQSALEAGATHVAVGLDSGGSRIYSREDVIRVASFGDEVEAATNAFASGFLLGWLLGADVGVSGALGNAASQASPKQKLPDRRELAARLAQVRTRPTFRKLVPVLSEAQRLVEKTRRLPRRDTAAGRVAGTSL